MGFGDYIAGLLGQIQQGTNQLATGGLGALGGNPVAQYAQPFIQRLAQNFQANVAGQVGPLQASDLPLPLQMPMHALAPGVNTAGLLWEAGNAIGKGLVGTAEGATLGGGQRLGEALGIANSNPAQQSPTEQAADQAWQALIHGQPLGAFNAIQGGFDQAAQGPDQATARVANVGRLANELGAQLGNPVNYAEMPLEAGSALLANAPDGLPLAQAALARGLEGWGELSHAAQFPYELGFSALGNLGRAADNTFAGGAGQRFVASQAERLGQALQQIRQQVAGLPQDVAPAAEALAPAAADTTPLAAAPAAPVSPEATLANILASPLPGVAEGPVLYHGSPRQFNPEDIQAIKGGMYGPDKVSATIYPDRSLEYAQQYGTPGYIYRYLPGYQNAIDVSELPPSLAGVGGQRLTDALANLRDAQGNPYDAIVDQARGNAFTAPQNLIPLSGQPASDVLAAQAAQNGAHYLFPLEVTPGPGATGGTLADAIAATRQFAQEHGPTLEGLGGLFGLDARVAGTGIGSFEGQPNANLLIHLAAGSPDMTPEAVSDAARAYAAFVSGAGKQDALALMRPIDNASQVAPGAGYYAAIDLDLAHPLTPEEAQALAGQLPEGFDYTNVAPTLLRFADFNGSGLNEALPGIIESVNNTGNQVVGALPHLLEGHYEASEAYDALASRGLGEPTGAVGPQARAAYQALLERGGGQSGAAGLQAGLADLFAQHVAGLGPTGAAAGAAAAPLAGVVPTDVPTIAAAASAAAPLFDKELTRQLTKAGIDPARVAGSDPDVVRAALQMTSSPGYFYDLLPKLGGTVRPAPDVYGLTGRLASAGAVSGAGAGIGGGLGGLVGGVLPAGSDEERRQHIRVGAAIGGTLGGLAGGALAFKYAHALEPAVADALRIALQGPVRESPLRQDGGFLVQGLEDAANQARRMPGFHPSGYPADPRLEAEIVGAARIMARGLTPEEYVAEMHRDYPMLEPDQLRALYGESLNVLASMAPTLSERDRPTLQRMVQVAKLGQAANPGAGDWYEGVLEGLHQLVGSDAPLLMEFAAITSPRTNVFTNAMEALQALIEYRAQVAPGTLFNYDAAGSKLPALRKAFAGEPWGELKTQDFINSFYESYIAKHPDAAFPSGTWQRFKAIWDANPQPTAVTSDTWHKRGLGYAVPPQTAEELRAGLERLAAYTGKGKEGLQTKLRAQALLDKGAVLDQFRPGMRIPVNMLAPIEQTPTMYKYLKALGQEAAKALTDDLGHEVTPREAQALLWFGAKQDWVNRGFARADALKGGKFDDILRQVSRGDVEKLSRQVLAMRVAHPEVTKIMSMRSQGLLGPQFGLVPGGQGLLPAPLARALVGAPLGALAGGVVGAQSDQPTEGALAGGALGAALGAGAGPGNRAVLEHAAALERQAFQTGETNLVPKAGQRVAYMRNFKTASPLVVPRNLLGAMGNVGLAGGSIGQYLRDLAEMHGNLPTLLPALRAAGTDTQAQEQALMQALPARYRADYSPGLLKKVIDQAGVAYDRNPVDLGAANVHPVVGAVRGAVLGNLSPERAVLGPAGAGLSALEGFLNPAMTGIKAAATTVIDQPARMVLAMPDAGDLIEQAAPDFLHAVQRLGGDVRQLDPLGRFDPEDLYTPGPRGGQPTMLTGLKPADAERLAATWGHIQDVAAAAGGQAATSAMGDFSHNAGGFLNAVFPGGIWNKEQLQVLARAAARHPAAALGAVALAHQQYQDALASGDPTKAGQWRLTDQTPGIGMLARLANGGAPGNLYVNPLYPFSPVSASLFDVGRELDPNLNALTPGYDRIRQVAGLLGLADNPAVDTAAYMLHASNETPTNPDRLAALGQYLDAKLYAARDDPLAPNWQHALGNMEVPNFVGAMLAPVGNEPDTLLQMASGHYLDPAIARAADELVFRQTGQPLDAPQNAGLLPQLLDHTSPLYRAALEQGLGGKAVGAALNYVSPMPGSARTEVADLEHRLQFGLMQGLYQQLFGGAPGGPLTRDELATLAQSPGGPALRAGIQQVLDRAQLAHPILRVGDLPDAQAIGGRLLNEWERQHVGLQAIPPAYNLERAMLAEQLGLTQPGTLAAQQHQFDLLQSGLTYGPPQLLPGVPFQADPYAARRIQDYIQQELNAR